MLPLQVPMSSLVESLHQFDSENALYCCDPIRQTETVIDELPEETLQWLRARGLPHQQLVARECGAAGRGLVAISRIRQGEALLRVPRQLVLTADDALAASQCSALLERADLPTWSVLAFFLVENRLSQASVWQPYVSMLPSSCECVLEWRQSQVGW
jgi:hypothetical protein